MLKWSNEPVAKPKTKIVVPDAPPPKAVLTLADYHCILEEYRSVWPTKEGGFNAWAAAHYPALDLEHYQRWYRETGRYLKGK